MSGFFPGGEQRQADGSGAREIVFDDLVPWEAFWSPIDATRSSFGPDDARINEAWPISSPDGKQLLVQHFILPIGQDTRDGAGWIAVMPADGSASARDIGARIDTTGDPDTWKTWSPDGAFVLQMVAATGRAYLVDPATGAATELPWADDIPEWQRIAR